MNNLLYMLAGSAPMFGFADGPNGNPALYIFGFPIYLYAIFIVTGMCLAVLIGGFLFKKRGYDPYDICIYALTVIPFGVLGARMYVFIFPWAGQQADWSTFFDFRDGGLGIYGGVIFGYLAALITSKVRKQNFRIVGDSIIPGLFIAQSIGRWGNFVNQEAYGNLITNPQWQWFPFAVEINGSWYQATFFYESLATFIGFVICLILLRSKKYKLGWLTAFYGVYYGIVRLLVEGLRTDSLYLWIGNMQTDIKISQLVSVFAIIMGVWGFSIIYRKQLHALYSKMFTSQRQEVAVSRWILTALVSVCVVISVVMYVLGGESKFLIGLALDCVAVYAFVGIFSLHDRLQLYCDSCGERLDSAEQQFLTTYERLVYNKYALIGLSALLAVAGIVLFILGLAVTFVDNHIVFGLMLVACALYGLFAIRQNETKIVAIRKEQGDNLPIAPKEISLQCKCGSTKTVKINKILLYIFPFKVYPDFGVENIKPWVDPKKVAKTTQTQPTE